MRAIVDHVPPLFGYKDFAEVASNYAWSATDRSYMKRLLDTKKQADEALHRQMSKKAGYNCPWMTCRPGDQSTGYWKSASRYFRWT